MTATEEQCRKVTQHALDFVHDIGDCLFCDLQGGDAAAVHEDFCPLRDIDPRHRPRESAPNGPQDAPGPTEAKP